MQEQEKTAGASHTKCNDNKDDKTIQSTEDTTSYK